MSPTSLSAYLAGMMTDPAFVLSQTLASDQVQANTLYNQQLANFQAASKAWIDQGVQLRALGQPIPPFTLPIPLHSVYSIVEGKIVGQDVQDPNVQLPVLPPKESTDAHSVQITSDANAFDTQVAQAIALMLHKLNAIEAFLKIPQEQQ